LQASYAPHLPITDPSVSVRLNQLCSLKEFVDECIKHRAAGEPILLMGDMNVNSRPSPKDGVESSEEYNLMHKILTGEISQPPTGGVLGVSSRSSALYVPRPLKVLDVLYKRFGEHPITFGDVTDTKSMTPAETVLTSEEGLATCGSIDYIFSLDVADASQDVSPDFKEFATIDISSSRIEKFLVEGEPYTQLSGMYLFFVLFYLFVTYTHTHIYIVFLCVI